MDTTVDDRMMDGSRGPRSEGVHASRDSRIGKVEVRASRDSRIGKVGDAGRRARRRLRASWTIEMTIEMGRDRASRELLATNRVDLVGKLLRHVAHLGAKIGHGVAQRLLGIIESGCGVESFNEIVRHIVRERICVALSERASTRRPSAP